MEDLSFDARDWGSLPDDVAANILARLPLVEFLRLRCVCKEWSTLAALQPQFARQQAALRSSRPGFALLISNDHASRISYLDINSPRGWRTLPLSFLPPTLAANLQYLASAEGLLLLGTPARELLVVNPVTREWVKLPERAAVQDPFYAALAGVEEGFLVVVAESELRDTAATEVYDSRTGHWARGNTPCKAGRWKRVASTMSLPYCYGSVPVYCKPAYCGGAFYHLTWDPEDMVAEFELSQAKWRCAKGRGSIPGGVPWGLMESGGKIFLLEMSYPKPARDVASGGAAATTKSAASCAALFLWELERDRLKWKLAARVPDPPDSGVRVDRWRRFAVGDGCVCATFVLPNTTVTLGARQSDAQPGLIFDVASSTWMKMPDLPPTPLGHSSALFSFRASLQGL